MMNEQTCKTSNTLPYPVILSAVAGDAEAVNVVLKHYEKYIIALATRPLHDEYGEIFYYLDDEARRKIETHFITKLLTFNVA
jgi:hypothetical protein